MAKAGGNLLIQGNQIDILALNHPETPFQSGGNLTLASDGIISGDAHFASGGNFSILNLAGSPGNFVSLYDAIAINGRGNITTREINASGIEQGGAVSVQTTGGNVRTDAIKTEVFASNPSTNSVTASGPINVSATGSITATNLISFFNGSSPSGSRGGDINLQAGGAIAIGEIDSFSNQFNSSSSSQGGSVTLTGSSIQFEVINTQSCAYLRTFSVGGNVTITANGVPNGTIRGTSLIYY